MILNYLSVVPQILVTLLHPSLRPRPRCVTAWGVTSLLLKPLTFVAAENLFTVKKRSRLRPFLSWINIQD